MIKIFDTHAHYDDSAYESDRGETISKVLSETAGFIAIGCSKDRANDAINFAEQYSNVYASVGIHPEFFNTNSDFKSESDLELDYLSTFRSLAKNPKVKSIGEIGLDYHYEGYLPELQQKVFGEFIELANEVNLPVIVHSRDAMQDTYRILADHKPKAGFVVHCFSGSAEDAVRLTKIGALLSFTGNITFKNARKAIESIAAVPLESIMLETDCPYMAPEPFRGKRCDSTMLIFIAQKIAVIKSVSLETVVQTCNSNAERFFGIKL